MGLASPHPGLGTTGNAACRGSRGPAAGCPGARGANGCTRIVFGSAHVYAAHVSEKPPQTYILHTVALFVVLVTIMVVFLKHQWG